MLERLWRKGTLLHCWCECKLVQSLWRTVWRLQIKIPYGLAIPLLGIYLEKTKIPKDTHTLSVHCSTVYDNQDMEETKCPSAEEQIKKMQYMHAMRYYAAIKRNSIGPFVEMRTSCFHPKFPQGLEWLWCDGLMATNFVTNMAGYIFQSHPLPMHTQGAVFTHDFSGPSSLG